jgi:16S rRNA (guanine(966)-N(2))-methyltransferase RsmD
MRIVAGRFKGRVLQGPTGAGVRPTSDGLRETLFNVLGPRVEGARVLDAFAGTGAVGLEALSRGARRATFVERDRRAAAVVQGNIAACRATNEAEVLEAEFHAARPGLIGSGPFDLVFLDPPYDYAEMDGLVADTAPLVAPGGRLVVEHRRRRALPDAAGGLTRYRTVVAGDSALSFYVPGPAADTMIASDR